MAQNAAGDLQRFYFSTEMCRLFSKANSFYITHSFKDLHPMIIIFRSITSFFSQKSVQFGHVDYFLKFKTHSNLEHQGILTQLTIIWRNENIWLARMRKKILIIQLFINRALFHIRGTKPKLLIWHCLASDLWNLQFWKVCWNFCFMLGQDHTRQL